MFLIYSARPATFEFMLQRLRLADSAKGIALNIFYQIDNAQSLVAILLNPLCEIFKGSRVKFQASHGLPRMEFRCCDPLLSRAVASCSRFSADKPFLFQTQSRATTQSPQSLPSVRRFHPRRIECQSCNLQRKAYARESIVARRPSRTRAPILKNGRSKGIRSSRGISGDTFTPLPEVSTNSHKLE